VIININRNTPFIEHNNGEQAGLATVGSRPSEHVGIKGCSNECAP